MGADMEANSGTHLPAHNNYHTAGYLNYIFKMETEGSAKFSSEQEKNRETVSFREHIADILGESINEYPRSITPVRSLEKSDKDDESWWEKRRKRMLKLAKEQEELASKKAAVRMRMQEEEWRREGIRQNIRHHQFLVRQRQGEQSGKEYDLYAEQAIPPYEYFAEIFGIDSLISGKGIL